MMTPGESRPWQPERLDDLLEEPFERMEALRGEILLRRLDEIWDELDRIEMELDELLLPAAECP